MLQLAHCIYPLLNLYALRNMHQMLLWFKVFLCLLRLVIAQV